MNAISVAIATKYDSSSISAGPIIFADGSAPAPSVTFVGSTGTGVYLAAANSLGFTANGVAAGSISSGGAWTIAAPASGNTLNINGGAAGSGLQINGAAGQYPVNISGVSTSGQSYGLRVAAGTTSADFAFGISNAGSSASFLYLYGDGHGFVGPNVSNNLSWSTAGAFTISAPSSGFPLTVNSTGSGSLQLQATAGQSPTLQLSQTAQTSWQIYGVSSSDTLAIWNSTNSNRVTITGPGNVTINAPTSGSALTIAGAASSNIITLNGSSTSGQSFGPQILCGTTSADSSLDVRSKAGTQYLYVQGNGETYIAEPPASTAPFGHQVGYLDAPQNIQNANYTLVMSDRGKMINHVSGGPWTYTIPANASVAFPVGTVIIVANPSGGNTVIAITTDTLTWAPSGSAGSRTLASNGVATLLKVGATQWMIYGTGLT